MVHGITNFELDRQFKKAHGDTMQWNKIDLITSPGKSRTNTSSRRDKLNRGETDIGNLLSKSGRGVKDYLDSPNLRQSKNDRLQTDVGKSNESEGLKRKRREK